MMEKENVGKIKTAIVCLRISSILYLVIGIIFILSTISSIENLIFKITIGILCIALFMFIEKVIHDLKKFKFWARVSALILFGTYIPSAFIVLGIPGLINLLGTDIRKLFIKKENSKTQNTDFIKKTLIRSLLIILLLSGLFVLLKSFFILNRNLDKYPEIQEASKVYQDYSIFSVQKSQSIYKAQLEKNLSGQLSEIDSVNNKLLETINSLKSIRTKIKDKQSEGYISGKVFIDGMINSLEKGEIEIIYLQKTIAEASIKPGTENEILQLEQKVNDIVERIYKEQDSWNSYLENLK